MRTLVRLVVVLSLAGGGLAGGTALLAPQARAVFGATDSARDPLPELQPLSERSVIYDGAGNVLAVLHAEENRLPVPIDRVPRGVVRAILDVEDERFYDHGGVDVRSLLRALYTNVRAGGVEQGGSTITQQLVKNALLTSKRDANRKVKEAVLAMRLEKKLSKREILERYLNTVYFGNGAYGIEAASERYFGVNVEQLTPGHAALLVGIIRNPVGYDPFVNPERARERRNLAIRRMLAHGDLNAGEARLFSAEALPTTSVDLLPKANDYFVEEVKQELLDDTRLGDTPTERYNAIFRGGLKIYTTLDRALELRAKAAVADILPEDVTKGLFTGSLITLDPRTGAVRALVGGRGYERSQVNIATQGTRQAGSAFKPFTLVTAFEQGYSPKDTINGRAPCRIANPGGTPDPWEPGNFEGERGRTMTLTDAMVHSVNCAYARLASVIGPNPIADTAERMGVTSKLDRVLAMTLGAVGGGLNPLDLASGYSTLAADGVHRKPYFIQKVADRDGKTIFEADQEGRRVISEQSARMTTQILQQVVEKGTGTKARLGDRPAAGKTGTAQDYEDAWFVGYTPQLVTAVWMGSPDGEVPMKNVGGIRVVGGSYPARIWKAFMEQALADQPVLGFPEPDPDLVPRGKYLRITDSKPCRTDRSRSGSSSGSTSRSSTSAKRSSRTDRASCSRTTTSRSRRSRSSSTTSDFPRSTTSTSIAGTSSTVP